MLRSIPFALGFMAAALAARAAEPRTLKLWDGSRATVQPGGFGLRTDAKGRSKAFAVVQPDSVGRLGSTGVTDIDLERRLALPDRGVHARGRVIVGLASAGSPVRHAAVKKMKALPAAGPSGAAMFVAEVAGDPKATARELRNTPGVLYAEPDWTVSSMASSPRPFPVHAAQGAAALKSTPPGAGVPSNVAVQKSLSSWLNANGVNAVAAYVELTQRYGQLPGQGTIITNVSVGDLTDQSMIDAGDAYVQRYGPTTIVKDGQRYLDYPSLPLIPTYVASADGALDPLGTVEFVDPFLAEVLLDFSVMAPLPHELQRPEARGDAQYDLLGIAPGAQYRLVVPQEPTISGILSAMMAAARQVPRPDVINASLGFGFDTVGYPGRYLEDDPFAQSVISTIVNQYGVVVCISANDGTRLFTPAAVNPDGGSAATDLVVGREPPTSQSDDAFTTIPTRVVDSGAMAVGGTTLDDVLSAPPIWGGPLARVGQFPELRINGAASFSSGFGTRVNIAAPSDNIPALLHVCAGFFDCKPQDSVVVLGGGTSASSPMVAAAAAVAIQAGRLVHKTFTPHQIRDLIVRTARPTTQAPQLSVDVGPQLDVTSLVEAILGARGKPAIARVSIAHRHAVSDLGATFETMTDAAAIDLQGPPDFDGNPSGQNFVGPITIAADVLRASDDTSFALRIGKKRWEQRERHFRLLPAEILSAAGLPAISTGVREVVATYEVRDGDEVIASSSVTLRFGPTDGTFAEAMPPSAPAVIAPDRDVLVRYDLRGVRDVSQPALLVSSVGHWSPVAAPRFRATAEIPLDALSGTVRVPASAFAAGAGIYGLGIRTNADAGFSGWYTAIRVGSGGARPEAPLFADRAGALGHMGSATRAQPMVRVQYDARAVHGANGAAIEISAPGPTLFGLYNTFTNAFGDRRDANGVETSSALFHQLGSTSGTAALDLNRLGLRASVLYNVRVFATRNGKPIGQASPSSALEFDDGFPPDGSTVWSFDATPGAPAVVAFSSSDEFGNLLSSALSTYEPATGVYAPPFATAAEGQFLNVVGSDPALGRVLFQRGSPFFWDGAQEFVTWDLAAGAAVGSVSVDSTQAFVEAARVDSRRHRAAVLGVNLEDFTDQVFSVDLRTGSWLHAPIAADVEAPYGGIFSDLDIDASSGKVLLGSPFWGSICHFFTPFLGAVDLDSGTAAPVVEGGPHCATAMVSDGKGNLWMPQGPPWAFPIKFPPGTAFAVDEGTFADGASFDLNGGGPLYAAIDSKHDLLVVGFMGALTYLEDNNAMGSIGVYDLKTGKQLSLQGGFNFLGVIFGEGRPTTVRGIQLDPSTRTGITYGPFNAQLQRFSY